MTKASALSAFAIFGFASSSALTLSAAFVLRNIQKNPEIKLYPQNLAWPLKFEASFAKETISPQPVVASVSAAPKKVAAPKVFVGERKLIAKKRLAPKKKHFAKRDAISISVSAVTPAPALTEIIKEVAPTEDDATSVLNAWKTLRGRMDHLAKAEPEVPAIVPANLAVQAPVAQPEVVALTELVTVFPENGNMNPGPRAHAPKKPIAKAMAKKKTVTIHKAESVPRISTAALAASIPKIPVREVAKAPAPPTPVIDFQPETFLNNQPSNDGWAVESQPAPINTHQVDAPHVSNPYPAIVQAATAPPIVNIQVASGRVSTASAGLSQNTGYSTPLFGLIGKNDTGSKDAGKDAGKVTAKGPGQALDEKINSDHSERVALRTDPQAAATDPNSNDTANKQAVAPALFYEAFDPSKAVAVESVTSHRISYEGFAPKDSEDTGAPGWMRFDALGFFPTLALRTKVHQALPILTQHSVGEIGVLGNQYLRDMGIVFGRIAQGYRLELAGQSPVTFTKDGINYFLAINIVPGHVALTLRHKDVKDGTKVTVRLPVQSGVATYADLGSVAFKQELPGSVGDDDFVASAEVEVFGTAKLAISKLKGEFALYAVPYIEGYPLELHTSRPNRSSTVSVKEVSEEASEKETAKEKNIFSVSPHHLTYPLFHPPSLETLWIQEINRLSSPGAGINPEASRLLASFTGLKLKKYGPLRVILTNYFEEDGIAPELYSIDEAGNLAFPSKFDDPKAGLGIPLDAGAPRIFGVNIPEGFWGLEILDSNGDVVWSKLLFFADRARTIAVE